MAKFIINGSKRLFGAVDVSGAKNAALPIIAATILISGDVTLENVPVISDIQAMAEILIKMGSKIKISGNRMTINTDSINSDIVPDYDLTRNMRGSILIAGPLLARFGKIKIAQPGGCIIGSRPIDAHLEIFRQMGSKISEDGAYYIIEAKKIKSGTIVLPELSVTTTENAIMALVSASGKSEIRLAAAEPHCEELANFLNLAGAKITGGGSHNIKISGVKKLSGNTKFSISPDPIEIATYAIAAAVSRGEVVINNIRVDHLDMFLNKFREANINFKIDNTKNRLIINPTTIFRPVYIRTDVWPGFPTDLQAPFAVLLTQAQGTSRIFETMYEGRLNYLKELIKMGANAVIQNSHEALITGPTPLVGKEIDSLDLRAGASLIIAALIAQGETIINKIELVDRGYEKIDEKLRKLGAEIKRVE